MRLDGKVTNCISLSRIVKFPFPNFEIGRVLYGRVIPHMRARKGQLWSRRIEIEEALEIAVDGLTHQNQSCWSTCTVARRDSTGVSTYTYPESRRATRRTTLLCGALSPHSGAGMTITWFIRISRPVIVLLIELLPLSPVLEHVITIALVLAWNDWDCLPVIVCYKQY